MVSIGTSIIFILVAMLAITLLNLVTFPRLRPNEPVLYPQVSVLIPVRDEAPIIKKTLAAWREQSYPNFEIIVLDDESQDSTYHIVREIAAQDSRLHLLRGSKMPPGWTGKNWACFQLAESAQGELIIFSDADVYWQPDALSGLVQSMQTYQSDLFTVWPSQKVYTWAERLVIPLMNFAVFCYLPEIFVRKVPLAAFAAANGQCLAFRKKAYFDIGTHSAVRETIIEDVEIARLIKRSGLKLTMALGNLMINARMYQGWKQVRDGFAKNILAGYFNQPLLLVGSTIFHWGLFILPWIWFCWELSAFPVWINLRLPLITILLGLLLRLISALANRDKPWDSIFLPVSVFMMTLIAWRALLWKYYSGGPRWKGRHINT